MHGVCNQDLKREQSWCYYLPMDGNVVLDMIDDLHKHVVAFSCIQIGPWELPVDGDNGFGGAQPGGVSHHHLYWKLIGNYQLKLKLKNDSYSYYYYMQTRVIKVKVIGMPSIYSVLFLSLQERKE